MFKNQAMLEKTGYKINTGAACSSACDSGLMHLCYGFSLFSFRARIRMRQEPCSSCLAFPAYFSFSFPLLE